MWSRLIHACYQQSNAIRSFTVDLCRSLGAVADLGDYAFERYGAAVGHFGGEGLLFHEVREDAGIRGKSSESNAKVLIYSYYFLLVRGELFCISLGDDRS